MLVSKVLSGLMFLTLVCGFATVQSVSAQGCHRFQPYPYAPANPYASGYGGYAPSPGYGGPMMGGGYPPSPYAQPAPYYPPAMPAMPSQSIYVGSPYSPPGYQSNYGGNGPRRDDRYDDRHDHHHSHHPWHLGHYLLGI